MDVFFPECGMSNISKYQGNAIKTLWTNPSVQYIVESMKSALDDVLIKHNLTVDDINWYCGSQFSMELFDEARKKCRIPREKAIYVGDKYGYTGTSSPFFAYTEGVKRGRIKRGDLILFTTIGIGHSICSMLVRR